MKFALTAILFSALLSITPMTASADVSLSINIAPPELPIYEQPVLPGDGYIWTPGYWAYSDDGYYWVPGTWMRPPQAGYLWTPGYWFWNDGFYAFRNGYWGPHVGYYGGVNYGYGYSGYGYQGGRWVHGRFSYNRTVNHINTTNVRNSYRATVADGNRGNRTSYNGGKDGINVRPDARQAARLRESHIDATPEQMNHQHAAHERPEMRQSNNHGQPPVAATPKASAFDDHGATAAREHNPGPEMTRRPQNQSHDGAPRSQPRPQARSMERPEQQQSPRPQQAPRPQEHSQQRQHPSQPQHEEHQQQQRPHEQRQEEPHR